MDSADNHGDIDIVCNYNNTLLFSITFSNNKYMCNIHVPPWVMDKIITTKH